jgi:hypothetical protein
MSVPASCCCSQAQIFPQKFKQQTTHAHCSNRMWSPRPAAPKHHSFIHVHPTNPYVGHSTSVPASCLYTAAADCVPGMTYNSTGNSNSNWCVACSTPYYCTGGSAANPLATPSECPQGLVTISSGAKSEAQCYTAGGFGRTTAVLPNGTAVVESVICPIGGCMSHAWHAVRICYMILCSLCCADLVQMV